MWGIVNLLGFRKSVCSRMLACRALVKAKYLVALSLFLLTPHAKLFASSAAGSNGSSIFLTLPIHIIHLILTIIGASAILVTLSIMFGLKVKKLNGALSRKNSEIEEANKNLETLNRELSEQRDRMARDLANSERIYEIMLESAEDGIALYSMDWKIQFGNKAFYNLIGYTKDEYTKIDPDERDNTLLHPDDIGYSDDRTKAIAEKGYFEKEKRIKHRNGKYVVLSAKSVLVKDNEGNDLGILLISRDVTSIREAQDELKIARDKAEESNRLKSTFLANISHEIRTPLNSIVGFANLLNDSRTTDEVREEYVGYLNQNTEKLLQIISDIIDLSRLENSEIEIHYDPIRINSILDEMEEYAGFNITKSGKQIEFILEKGVPDGKDMIYSDEIWLKRVLRHLLDNAVKFTREGTISLSCTMAGTSLMIRVTDSGIGISKDHLDSIFEQFRQEVGGHHRPFEGLGVGLTLAKHVIEQMDGFLWVESEKGRGSKFFFTIPYRPVDSGRKQDLIKPPPEEKVIAGNEDMTGGHKENWWGKKILVTDDNNDILNYLDRILTDTGLSVIRARSGEETVEIVKNNEDIDMVLIDMQMPGMNGLEATSEIRKLRKKIPIIAHTAFIYEEEQKMILDAGCDACIIKPIRQEQLYSVISGFLG